MKAVILAGGTQSTVSDSYMGIPKPMAEIGQKPILWHIMKSLSSYGVKEFIICGGYKVNMIKDYFRDYYIYQSDITVDLVHNTVECHKKRTEDWDVTIVNTGMDTEPGKRLLMVQKYIPDDDFIVVHGDCVSDINIEDLIQYHKKNNKVLTLALAKPTGRNEMLPINERGEYLTEEEAILPQNQAWADACCRVFKQQIFDYLKRDTNIGKALFCQLGKENEIIGYFHEGFWCPLETIRDKKYLENLWKDKKAPWLNW